MSNRYVVPPRGMSITLHGSTVMCDGIPVLEVDDPGDHVALTKLNGLYLDIYIQRRDKTLYSVIVDLDAVGLDDQASVRVDLDPSVQVAIPPRKLLNQAA